jgi:antitoxin component of MazEF toxin-antitoxin module
VKGKVEKCGNSYHIRVEKAIVERKVFDEGEEVKVSKIKEEAPILAFEGVDIEKEGDNNGEDAKH